MQKVEGSSPFIRSQKPRKSGLFNFFGSGQQQCMSQCVPRIVRAGPLAVQGAGTVRFGRAAKRRRGTTTRDRGALPHTTRAASGQARAVAFTRNQQPSRYSWTAASIGWPQGTETRGDDLPDATERTVPARILTRVLGEPPRRGAPNRERLVWFRRAIYLRVLPVVLVLAWVLGPLTDSSTVLWVVAVALTVWWLIGLTWGTLLIRRERRD